MASLLVSKYPREFELNPKGILFCKICLKELKSKKKDHLNQHRATKKHQEYLSQLTKDNLTQQRIKFASKSFHEKITEAFLEAGIPLYKFRCKKLRAVFEQIEHPLPSNEKARGMIPKFFDQKMEFYVDTFKDEKIFLIIFLLER